LALRAPQASRALEGDATMVAKSELVAPAHLAGATPLLGFLAGEFAGPVASIWRAPHADFLALPTARRHAAALVLSGLAHAPPAGADLRRMLDFARDAAVAGMLTGGPAPGLMRTLGKLGEVLWSKADYCALVDLFGDPAANEALRHIEVVRPDWLRVLARLPPALRAASVLRAVVSESAAADLALAFRLALAMREAAAAPRLAERWTSGGDAAALFARAKEDLTPDAFLAPATDPRLPEGFVRVTTRRMLERAALDFRNCLLDHAPRVAEGRMAVFLWAAAPPAVLALARDAAGWRLAEIKRADNADLEEAELRRLAAELARAGVRTGPSLETLRRRLDDHAYGVPQHGPGLDFVERLELGDLWS
jgi:hypothetical protein